MAEHDEALWLHVHQAISMIELSECAGFSEQDIRELVEYGVISPCDPENDPASGAWRFSADCLARMRRAARLREDFELQLPELALVLSFLERIEALEAEVRNLSAQLPMRGQTRNP